MFHEIFIDDEFFQQLVGIDERAATAAQAAGCPRCGGRLHRADFARKVRGVEESMEKYFAMRFGLCCSVEGCRRRVLPPSVRFLGRKVYAAITILTLCLTEALDRGWQERRRIGRWLAWWRSLDAHPRYEEPRRSKA